MKQRRIEQDAYDGDPSQEIPGIRRKRITIGGIATFMLAAAIVALGPIGAALAMTNDVQVDSEIALRKEQDEDEVAIRVDDDDDGDDSNDGIGPRGDTSGGGTNNSFTSGVNSNDGTNSRVTPVSRDRDRSRGDLTKDRTKDGPGPSTRDWSKNRTNDRSRHDTR